MHKRMIAILVLLTFTGSAYAQVSVYTPLSGWRSPLASWEISRSTLEASSRQATTKPIVPGLRPVSVELLEDALLRKHNKLLQNNEGMARRLIVRKYLGKGTEKSRVSGRNQLNGAMAEALFLWKNPEWNYVSKPNAPQNDVYRFQVGRRTPFNGQIKFHGSGNAALYAQDMVKDYRANHFYIPDDHVQLLKDHCQNQYERALSRGDSLRAQQAARNIGRVQPLGFTSEQVLAATKAAYESVATERNSVYVSLAAGIAISMGHIGWDYAHGHISEDQAAYRSTKAMTLIGSGVAADAMLISVKDGALRGTMRGNLIVGAVILLVDTSWNVYEQGGMAAFRHPEFYEQLGGSMSAIGIGGAAGLYSGAAATVAASELGPGAPVVGGVTALVVGTGAGLVAYAGGRTTTGWLVRSMWPELYQQYEQQQIDAAKQSIADRISNSQKL